MAMRPILELWKSEEKHKHTLTHGLAGWGGGLVAAIGGRQYLSISKGCVPWQRCSVLVDQAEPFVIKNENIHMEKDLC